MGTCEGHLNSAYHKHWLLREGRRDSSQPSHVRKYIADHSVDPPPNHQRLQVGGSGSVPHFHCCCHERAKTRGRSSIWILAVFWAGQSSKVKPTRMAIGVSHSSIARPIDQGWPLHKSPGRGFKHLDQPTTTLRSKASSPRDMLDWCRGICRVFACAELTPKCDGKGQPVNQNMVRRDFDLLSELRYPKAYDFVFLGGARFPLSWDLATTAKDLQQHQFLHSRRESCSIAAAISGLPGA